MVDPGGDQGRGADETPEHRVLLGFYDLSDKRVTTTM